MPTGIENGYGAPFVRLYYGPTLEEISGNIKDFEFLQDEEGDDVIKIDLVFDDRNAPDKPYTQEKQQLKVIWGWIQGEVSKAEKIYIQDVAWDMDRDFLRATIQCTEKAVSLKFDNSLEVHHNTNIAEIAFKAGKRHELNVSIEGDGDQKIDWDTNIKPGESIEDLIQRTRNKGLGKTKVTAQQRGRALELLNVSKIDNAGGKKLTPKTIDPEGYQDHLTPNEWNLRSQAEAARQAKMTPAQLKELEKSFDLRNHANIPQANRSTKETLNDVGAKENNGPYFAETHGDDLIIKKRNFYQTPYKTFEYGGNDGLLLSFKPESKNRNKKSHNIVGFAGWDPLNKNSFNGNSGPQNDDSPWLTLFKAQYRFYKGAQDAGQGHVILGANKKIKKSGVETEFALTTSVLNALNHPTDAGDQKAVYNNTRRLDVIGGGVNALNARGDNTRNRLVSLGLPMTINDKVAALKRTLDNYNETLKNAKYSPSANNPYDAMNEANNDRRAAELRINPATCKMVGDPNLRVGIILTFIGISKKYSGNYYVIKANHKITKSEGYITELTLVRPGQNIVGVKKKYLKHDEAIAKLNNEQGPKSTGPRKKKVPVIKGE